MHTSAFESCRIHHNGGFGGDIYITNKDSTSKPVGAKSEIKLTTRKLINCYKRMDVTEKQVTVVGDKDKDDEDIGTEITILTKDIECFIGCILYDKIREKLNDMDYHKLLKIAEIMGIKQ